MTSSATGVEGAVRTSIRARWCIGGVVAGSLAFAVIAGVPNAPVTTPLPRGAAQPGWAVHAARWLGLARVGRPGLIVVSLLVMAGMLAAFGLLLAEAWSGRVRTRAALIGAALALAAAAAAPILLSRDVFSYAGYARVAAVHHADPYVADLAQFHSDPFVAVTSAQWLHTHSVYGPLFTLLGEAVVRIRPASPGGAILAFKVLAALGIAVATVCAVLAARTLRRPRAALAAVVVGLNPVVVVHTVGGGHVDALIAAPLAAALALAVHRFDGERAERLRAPGVTVLLAAAGLFKIAVAPALVLWLWWTLRSAPRSRRARVAAWHVLLMAGIAAAALIPFAHGLQTFRPLVAPGGVEAWASPSHLLGHGVQGLVAAIAGSGAGRTASHVVEAAFLLAFVALLWRIGRAWTEGSRGLEDAADAWGAALLLLALAMPFLLPWYVAWFVPFMALLGDEVLLRAGVVACGVLALTLIPADPFHGYSTWGVMATVHYVAAPVMLALFVVCARRIRARPLPLTRWSEPS